MKTGFGNVDILKRYIFGKVRRILVRMDISKNEVFGKHRIFEKLKFQRSGYFVKVGILEN